MNRGHEFGADGSAATDITHELLWVRGSDAVSYLDSMLSQDIAAMRPGEVARSLLLAPSGKLRALLWVLRGEIDVGLVADVGYGSQAASDLNRYRLRVEVTVDDRPTPIYSVVGVAADGWEIDHGHLTISADLGSVPRQLTDRLGEGVALLSSDLAEALRIEAGEPRMGVDVDESTIPQESGLVPTAVNFSKGCYLGQELVARIANRGHVNRRLAAVVVADPALPAGATLLADGRDAGVLTSVAWSPVVSAMVGMGLVRHEAQDGTSVEVQWEGGAATGEVRRLPLRQFALS